MSNDDRIITIVDTETTGTDVKKDELLEVSWALMHVGTAQVLEVHSALFHATGNRGEAINGISPKLLAVSEKQRGPVNLGREVVAVVAHNASFDRQWGAVDTTAPWLCTQDDWHWPKAGSSRSLVSLALAHGVGVSQAHRAFADVLTLAALLERVHETVPLYAQLEFAMKPRATFIARVSYADRELAKTYGFRWQAESKTWVKRMLVEETKNLPFDVVSAMEGQTNAT
jgi:DNA polymerase-3 subunit epsilon